MIIRLRSETFFLISRLVDTLTLTSHDMFTTGNRCDSRLPHNRQRQHCMAWFCSPGALEQGLSCWQHDGDVGWKIFDQHFESYLSRSWNRRPWDFSIEMLPSYMFVYIYIYIYLYIYTVKMGFSRLSRFTTWYLSELTSIDLRGVEDLPK